MAVSGPKQLGLFQNFGFWDSCLEFGGKNGYSAAFSKSL
jgi:hypothetical protein